MSNPKSVFSRSLVDAIEPLGLDLDDDQIEKSVDYCDPKFGEFSTNICFLIAKQIKSQPSEASTAIIERLNRDEFVAEAEFMPPGFINVRMIPNVWRKYVSGLNTDFASSKKGSGSSMQVEFISANPTGPLVLTNAWQGYYGDILANILASQGYRVEREYYLNDGGNQIVSLGKAVQQSLGLEFEEEVSAQLYRGEYVDEVAKTIAGEYGGADKVLSAEPAQIGSRAAEIILESYIKPDLARLGVVFDSIYSESSPDLKKTLERLQSEGLTKTDDGAVWLTGAKVGLNQDEVLVRSYDKDYSYFFKDVAYQLERLEERGFDRTITVVGPDHHGQSVRLKNTLKHLGHEGFEQISTQTIRLIKDGSEFKMSKRKGNYILLDDFLNSVPTEAARFYFAMRDTNTHMDFDIDLVKEHSSKNPVYYSLYAYARACSIEEKAGVEKLTSTDSIGDYELNEVEKRLFLEISKVPGLLAEISDNYKVHKLLHQVYDIAKVFHEYYESDRVIKSEKASQKLYLIGRFKLAYEAIFGIIGVTLLEKM